MRPRIWLLELHWIGFEIEIFNTFSGAPDGAKTCERNWPNSPIFPRVFIHFHTAREIATRFFFAFVSVFFLFSLAILYLMIRKMMIWIGRMIMITVEWVGELRNQAQTTKTETIRNQTKRNKIKVSELKCNEMKGEQRKPNQDSSSP